MKKCLLVLVVLLLSGTVFAELPPDGVYEFSSEILLHNGEEESFDGYFKVMVDSEYGTVRVALDTNNDDWISESDDDILTYFASFGESKIAWNDEDYKYIFYWDEHKKNFVLKMVNVWEHDVRMFPMDWFAPIDY